MWPSPKIYKTNVKILKRVEAVKKKKVKTGKKSKCNIKKGSDDIKNYETRKLSKPA